MVRDEIFTSLNCCQVGTVTQFDDTGGSATIQIAMKRVVYNQPQALNAGLPQTPNVISYPVLVKCPAFALMGGGASIAMPIAPGDTCLVIFNDRDMSDWFATGSATSQPPTARVHSLSDGFALVGIRSLANALTWHATDVLMRQTGAGKWNIENDATSLRGLMDAIVVILGLLNGACGSPATSQIAAFATAEASLLS